MKHIKDILALRQAGLAQEKGSREWGAFNAVRDDRISLFDVKQPARLSPQRSRIEMPQSHPSFFPRPAHSN